MQLFGFALRRNGDAAVGLRFEGGEILAGDESELLGAAKTLYPHFQTGGGGTVSGEKGTFIGHGMAGSGVFGTGFAFAAGVFGKAAGGVRGNAGIKAAVGAAENIGVICRVSHLRAVFMPLLYHMVGRFYNLLIMGCLFGG